MYIRIIARWNRSIVIKKKSKGRLLLYIFIDEFVKMLIQTFYLGVVNYYKITSVNRAPKIESKLSR